MASTDLAYCPECGDLRLVDVPFCADGHGDQCPERACVDCGAALFLDPVTVRRRARRGAVRAA